MGGFRANSAPLCCACGEGGGGARGDVFVMGGRVCFWFMVICINSVVAEGFLLKFWVVVFPLRERLVVHFCRAFWQKERVRLCKPYPVLYTP